MISPPEMVARITIGTFLGGIIGYERDRHRRPVGLRTHSIVAMAAATFMVVSSQFVFFQHYGKDDLVTIDASRIAASVVSAVGFLGAGTIIRTGVSVQGVTTAAGLWLVTAIGLSSGAGMFVVSAFATLLGMFVLTVLRRFEDKDRKRSRLSVVLSEGAAGSEAIVRALREVGAQASEVEYERRLDDEKKHLVVTFDLECSEKVTAGTLIGAIEKLAGVRRVTVTTAG